ncbi:MAG: SHOCT domain-containing protein [Rhizobiales bacterium]|nr:SHOCT domain-containing protein [Hyphomicrobiales bacterium]
MGWWNGFGSASWLSYGPIIMLVLMAGGGLLVYFMMRGQRGEMRNDIALHILKERYARGEIDKDEYEERRRGLDA